VFLTIPFPAADLPYSKNRLQKVFLLTHDQVDPTGFIVWHQKEGATKGSASVHFERRSKSWRLLQLPALDLTFSFHIKHCHTWPAIPS
jgi:hypothetical protein